MNISLTFNNFTFSPVISQKSLWIRSTELACALGYAREDKVNQIYQRHADEFIPDMTQMVENISEPQNEVQGNLSAGRCRIFSLRGCHLVAMFARTPVAKTFRKWVLDVLDQLAAEERARLTAASNSLPEVSANLTPSTAFDRKPLRAIVNAWSRICGQPQNNLWPQMRAAFNLVNIKELPAEWVPDAIAWVQDKIDALSPAPEQPALPATPAFVDERIQIVQFAVSEVQKRGSAFISSIFALQSAMRRPLKTDPGVGELAKALEQSLPNFGTAIGMNVSALSELLDVYGATLTAGH